MEGIRDKMDRAHLGEITGSHPDVGIRKAEGGRFAAGDSTCVARNALCVEPPSCHFVFFVVRRRQIAAPSLAMTEIGRVG
jgi:hypothetical protein